MMIRTKYEKDLTSGCIWKKILLFALPLMLSSVLQLLYNACDIVVIGRFRDHTALSAISSTSSLINLITNLFIGLSVGSNIVMAKCYGQNDKDKAQKVVRTSIIISLISGIILAIFGVVFAKQLLLLMGSPSDVINLATIYLQIFFIGMPFNLLYNFGSSILRASGDTKRPLYFLLISGLFNVGANLLFVIVFNMSTDGVALATIISQFISALLILITLLKEKGFCHLSLKELKIDKNVLLEIAKVGLPAGLQGTIFSISNVIIQSSVNFFGSYVMAGNGAAANLEGFIYVCMNAFYQASITFTSQNYGAKKYDNIPKILKYNLYLVVLFGGILGITAYLSSGFLLNIYTTDPDVIKIGTIRMGIICVPYFLCGMMDVVVGSLRGLGKSTTPMIVSLLGVCGLRILWIFTIFRSNMNLGLLYVSYPISWIITFMILIVCFIYLYKKVASVELKLAK